MSKLFLLVTCFFCMNAFAGYQCDLSLADSEDLTSILATRKIEASDKELGTKNIEKFLTEFKMGKDTTSLRANVFISGWPGEEEISVSFTRREVIAEKTELTKISDKVSLRGSAENSMWFENYKFEISCSLT